MTKFRPVTKVPVKRAGYILKNTKNGIIYQWHNFIRVTQRDLENVVSRTWYNAYVININILHTRGPKLDP